MVFCGCAGLSLLLGIAANWGYSLVVVLGLLIVVVSLVADHRLYMCSCGHNFSSCGTVGSVVEVPELRSTGSIVVAHRLSCSSACRIFLDQG